MVMERVQAEHTDVLRRRFGPTRAKEGHTMTTPIPMDDLRPDLWVTIRDDITDAEFPAFGVELDARELWRRLRSRTPVKPGTPMRVIAVDLPFIYVVVLKADGQEDGPLILDLRRFPVVKISTSVPEAILEFADMKLRSNYEHSLATAATEAAVEAKAEIVKCSLLADAMNGEGVESAEGEGEAEGGSAAEQESALENEGASASEGEGDSDSDSESESTHSSATNRHPESKNPSPYYENGDESESTDEDPLDHWFRGDEDGEAA